MKVFVGMSGGVDSSVSAALLKEQGCDVTGVFIKTWHPDFLACTWREDRGDAMRVCAAIGIPFITLDLEDVYKREVADYMVREYAAGRTPNPDVMCNQHVKFGAFFAWAREQGADMVATGHYARVDRQRTADNGQGIRLLAGIDTTKDQSYFLWTLTQGVLAHVAFPVGSMKKADVRKEAERFGLPVAHKKDSQGVCFLGEVDMKEFLKRFARVTPGEVLDENARVIGTHDGALLYTLGERRGFTITVKTPHDPPRYIIAKDMERNTITVSTKPKESARARTTHATLERVNWIAGTAPDDSESLSCRFRYRQQLSPCRYEGRSGGIAFADPAAFVTPGQSLVIYRGDEVVGGGIIGAVGSGA